MPKVLIKLPKTGLGNMMLVWARGALFAKLNGLEYITTSWWGFHWGALLRRERKSRLYRNYFKESSLVDRFVLTMKNRKSSIIKEPPVEKLTVTPTREVDFLFNTVVTGNDLYENLRDHHNLVIEEFNKILHPLVKNEVVKHKAPFIGVHIRRGDFILGKQTTHLSYFIDGINLIRKVTGENSPVTIFTDAHEDELQELKSLPQIYFAAPKTDIADILVLSKSRILLLSRSSTFGYWAAFFSEAFVIRPNSDWQQKIRNPKDGHSYREIKWDDKDSASCNQLLEALSQSSIAWQ